MRSPVPGQPVPASAIDRLTAMANGYARVNGGGTAEWASAVVTTRDKALTSAYPGYRGGAVLWNAAASRYWPMPSWARPMFSRKNGSVYQ
jgi:hypothetical protein